MTTEPAKILIVEDETALAKAISRVLTEDEGYAVELAETLEKGLSLAINGNFDVVLTDKQLPGLTGMEYMGGIKLLTRLRTLKPQVPVIIMTAFHTADVAIEAVKLGAYDY